MCSNEVYKKYKEYVSLLFCFVLKYSFKKYIIRIYIYLRF